MGMRNDIKIGEVAKQSGVNVQTIRYYERVGLLKPIYRRESGYRIYDSGAIRIIRFVKHAQELGFSLEEVQALLRLKADGTARCEGVQKRAQEHLKEVRLKIDGLERIRSVLEDLIQRCRRRKTDGECPILDALDKE